LRAREVEWQSRMAATPRAQRRLELPAVYERARGCVQEPLRPWRRREPEKTVLWKLVASELPRFAAAVEEATSRNLPRFAAREFSDYLGCGLLERGFARVKCRDCKSEILVA
jgi:hypothetical protein